MSKLPKTKLILLLFLFSCAGIKPIKKPKRGPIDNDVEKTFQQMEAENFDESQLENLEREQVLDYYFKLRLQDQENQREERKSNQGKNAKIYQPPARVPIRPARPKPTPRIVSPQKKKPKIQVDPQENQIRMNQMLSFHCMKSRGGDSCQERTQRIKQSCQDEYDIDDKRLIRCIETKLR